MSSGNAIGLHLRFRPHSQPIHLLAESPHRKKQIESIMKRVFIASIAFSFVLGAQSLSHCADPVITSFSFSCNPDRTVTLSATASDGDSDIRSFSGRMWRYPSFADCVGGFNLEWNATVWNHTTPSGPCSYPTCTGCYPTPMAESYTMKAVPGKWYKSGVRVEDCASTPVYVEEESLCCQAPPAAPGDAIVGGVAEPVDKLDLMLNYFFQE